jgi:two-component system CheB/CheR fusion protein
LGLKAIKGAGGMIMVQTPETAKYDGMPRSAIATNLADYILSPAEMPTHLVEYVTDFRVKLTDQVLIEAPHNQAALQKVFILLRDYTGHDFSHYKQSTIERRLHRRMAVHQIESPSDYVRYLVKEPAEIKTLFKELLIGVTNFFRDPEAYEALKVNGLPYLLENRLPNQPLRVWVAGCATGEEAYSIAIIIKEYLTEHNLNARVQVFASDIDAEAIEFARSGTYPDGIVVDVSLERLNRFFTPNDGTYRINADIREMIVFAEQSIVKDPPFSHLDLISCRNVLIYLQAELQQKILNLGQGTRIIVEVA